LSKSKLEIFKSHLVPKKKIKTNFDRKCLSEYLPRSENSVDDTPACLSDFHDLPKYQEREFCPDGKNGSNHSEGIRMSDISRGSEMSNNSDSDAALNKSQISSSDNSDDYFTDDEEEEEDFTTSFSTPNLPSMINDC
jgi:hypothetical protein